MAKVQTLRSEFNGTAVPLGWAQFTGGSATFTYDATGATVNFPATTSSSTDGDDTTSSTYSLIDSYALVNILAIPSSSAVNAFGIMRLQITSTDFVSWQFNSGNLIANNRIASADSTLFSTAWSATTHAWVRIRESNGTTFWDTSTDGVSWVNRFSKPNPITETGLTVLLGGVDTGVDTSPGTFKWRSFNIAPAGVRFNNLGLRPHPFSPGLAK